MSEHANFGIYYYFHIITLVPKRKRPKPGRSSSHLRCVKATRLTSGEVRRAEDLNWESEIGSLSQSLASHTLYLLFSSSSEAFLGLFVLVPQSSVRPQLASPKCLPEVGHGQGEERQTLVCEELSCLPGT